MQLAMRATLPLMKPVENIVQMPQPRRQESILKAFPLTPREHQVLALVAEGNSNKLIAAQLGISERTVKHHLTYITSKLGAFDRTHAVVTAVRLGWLAL